MAAVSTESKRFPSPLAVPIPDACAETWSAEVTPGLLERGAEIETRLGLALGYRESPRLALARLSRGYRKLGLRSRAELAARLTADGSQAANPRDERPQA